MSKQSIIIKTNQSEEENVIEHKMSIPMRSYFGLQFF